MNILRIIVMMITFAPALIYYLGFGTSMALGVSLISLISIIILIIKFRYIFIKNKLFYKITVILLFILLFIFSHILLLGIFIPIDYERALLSTIPIGLVISCGYFLANIFLNENDLIVDRINFQICWVFLLIGFFAAIGFMPPGSEKYFKPIFPFTEPSLYSLALLPFLMYCVVRSDGYFKVFYIIIGIGIALALQSLTMLIGLSLIILMCFRFNIIYLILAIIIGLLSYQIDYSYYWDRLNFSNDNRNLSFMVWMQGWQLIVESLSKSSWLGLGFQQLGINRTSVEYSDYIIELIGSNSNLLDGGFSLVKIISEFGIFGIILIISYIYLTFNSIKSLRLTIKGLKYSPYIILFSHVILVSYSVELFIRGQGYFTGTSVMLAMAITSIVSFRRQIRSSRITVEISPPSN